MSSPVENKQPEGQKDQRPEKRKVAELFGSKFRGWDLLISGRRFSTVQTEPEAAKFLALAEAGTFLQELIFDSPEFKAEFNRVVLSAGQNAGKVLKWTTDYHAGRVAYLMFKGWDTSPIRLAADGDMLDGQHRLLAAVFLKIAEVDVLIPDSTPPDAKAANGDGSVSPSL